MALPTYAGQLLPIFFPVPFQKLAGLDLYHPETETVQGCKLESLHSAAAGVVIKPNPGST